MQPLAPTRRQRQAQRPRRFLCGRHLHPGIRGQALAGGDDVAAEYLADFLSGGKRMDDGRKASIFRLSAARIARPTTSPARYARSLPSLPSAVWAAAWEQASAQIAAAERKAFLAIEAALDEAGIAVVLARLFSVAGPVPDLLYRVFVGSPAWGLSAWPITLSIIRRSSSL